ncbi:hypothetical protein ACROYT_G044369 [Oculina patagonica]
MQWAVKMKRSDSKFKSNTSLFCCSEHFVATDYKHSLSGKRKDLLPSAIPSRFQWTKTSSLEIERAMRCERRESQSALESHTREKSTITCSAACSKNEGHPMETSEVKRENEHQSEDLTKVIVDLKRQLALSKFGVERFKHSDDDIFFYTGFPNYNTLMAFWEYVKPCAESLITWNFARGKSEENMTAFPYLHDVERERERGRSIEPIDQLWMFLTRIRLGLFERDLAHRYGVALATVSDILITWVNYLYIMLGSLPVWVPKNKIKQHLPEAFKGRYEDIRGIFDCTEIKCDMPKDYQTHSEFYSDYKSHDTYKGFICISPNCWVTFVSHLYPGRISDREIVEKSDFCSLVEPGDKYLADKGFDVHDLMALKGASLYIPPKRQSVQDQFTKDECFETMSIANVRIHVERSIKRVKAWHIFDQVIPLTMHGCINQLWTVASLIVNFQNPILTV